MNYGNFIRALAREFDKELKKAKIIEPDLARNIFDRAATTALTQAIDKQTKLGTPKGA